MTLEQWRSITKTSIGNKYVNLDLIHSLVDESDDRDFNRLPDHAAQISELIATVNIHTSQLSAIRIRHKFHASELNELSTIVNMYTAEISELKSALDGEIDNLRILFIKLKA
jgi:hypothetical protein